MKLAAIEYRDIRLRPKLNKMCSEEKAVYCKDVKPGKARVVKCLMENMAQPNFGEECAEELKKREDVMKNDYRYDIGVFTSCKVSGGFWGAGEVGIDDIMQSHTVMIRCSVGSTLSLPSPPCTYPPTPSLLHRLMWTPTAPMRRTSFAATRQSSSALLTTSGRFRSPARPR